MKTHTPKLTLALLSRLKRLVDSGNGDQAMLWGNEYKNSSPELVAALSTYYAGSQLGRQEFSAPALPEAKFLPSAEFMQRRFLREAACR